jgi:hypothetical protein
VVFERVFVAEVIDDAVCRVAVGYINGSPFAVVNGFYGVAIVLNPTDVVFYRCSCIRNGRLGKFYACRIVSNRDLIAALLEFLSL